MNTKYNFEFSTDVIKKYTIRLTNQLWKLIPMRENNEDWQASRLTAYSRLLREKVTK